MFKLFKQVRSAVSMLNPDSVREIANRPIAVGLVANTSSGYADMEDFLSASGSGLLAGVYRAGDRDLPENVDLLLYEQGIPCPANAFTFYRYHPEETVEQVLSERDDLGIALANRFAVFRKPVVDRVVRAVARENALFAATSALPNVVPSLLGLGWAAGEFVSDTAFITLNQVRMAFLIGAASGRRVGFSDQPTEIASIAAGAFGWRAIARELVGKIPLGGGIIPKGAVAYAGTFVVGKGIEHYLSIGRVFTRLERQRVYNGALEDGRAAVERAMAGPADRPAPA